MSVDYSILLTNGRAIRKETTCFWDLKSPYIYLQFLPTEKIQEIIRTVTGDGEESLGIKFNNRRVLIDIIRFNITDNGWREGVSHLIPQEIILYIDKKIGKNNSDYPKFLRHTEFILHKFPCIINPNLKSALSEGVRISAASPSTNIMSVLSLIREGLEYQKYLTEFDWLVSGGIKPDLALILSRGRSINNPNGREKNYIFPTDGHSTFPNTIPLESIKKFIRNGKAPIDTEDKIYSETKNFRIQAYWWNIAGRKAGERPPTINERINKLLVPYRDKRVAKEDLLSIYHTLQEELLNE